MRIGKVLLSAAVALSLAACNQHPDQEFVDSTPDMNAIGLELQGGAAEGLEGSSALTSRGASLVADDLGSMSQAITTVPEYLQAARTGIKELNQGVRKVVDPVLAIIAEEAGKAEAGQSRSWTKDLTNVSLKLTIKKFAAGRFGWKVQAKPVGGDDAAYVLVMGGGVVRGAEAHRGRGSLGIDLDAWKSVDPSFVGQGKLLCGYGHREDSKTLVYGLKAFTPDPAVHAPVTATFVGHRVGATGESAARVVSFTNLEQVPNNTAAKELLRVRARWVPGTGGRGDLFATGGDIPDNQFYYGAGCWDASAQEVFKTLFHCTRRSGLGSLCEQVTVVGTRDACAASMRAEPSATAFPDDLTDASLEDGAPSTDVSAPATVTDGTATSP